MVPTPLQLWPLSQRPLGALAQTTEPLGFVPPPQHCWVATQVSPVTLQPLALAQTGTPPPRSTHTLVQQVVKLEQGTPSWLQLLVPPEPPVRRHRPTEEPVGIPQTALQQSALAWQMSP